MNSLAHPIIGVDPDAFCTPDFFELHTVPFFKRGWVIAAYPTGTCGSGRNWKDRVASLAETRFKNRKITDKERRSILSWLELNRHDYKMLPPGQDPRFAAVDCPWIPDWGWSRNAGTLLKDGAAAVVSAKEFDPAWGHNPKWRKLLPDGRIANFVPELDEDERTWSVRRDADSLASLVAHPLRFGDVLKMIDPYADFERWHPTLDAMVRHANPGIVIELHCSRRIAAGRGKTGPSECFRNAWENWASSQRPGKLRSFHVCFWEALETPVAELHDRHVIIGATIDSASSQPFAGVSVFRGWDQAPPHELNLETSFSIMSRKDQKLHWEHYSDQSKVFSRDRSEDVLWIQNK